MDKKIKKCEVDHLIMPTGTKTEELEYHISLGTHDPKDDIPWQIYHKTDPNDPDRHRKKNKRQKVITTTRNDQQSPEVQELQKVSEITQGQHKALKTEMSPEKLKDILGSSSLVNSFCSGRGNSISDTPCKVNAAPR